jgi:hypothetical protein
MEMKTTTRLLFLLASLQGKLIFILTSTCVTRLCMPLYTPLPSNLYTLFSVASSLLSALCHLPYALPYSLCPLSCASLQSGLSNLPLCPMPLCPSLAFPPRNAPYFLHHPLTTYPLPCNLLNTYNNPPTISPRPPSGSFSCGL